MRYTEDLEAELEYETPSPDTLADHAPAVRVNYPTSRGRRRFGSTARRQGKGTRQPGIHRRGTRGDVE